MDIHPPEHPIRSVRDFAIQIFTVTCGILIALALEGLVVGHREARLARETRADFAAEMSENLDTLQQVQGTAAGVQGWMQAALTWGDLRLKHQPAKLPGDIAGRKFAALPHAAWDTALATQAMPLLTFHQARALAKAYNEAFALNEFTARARDQWVELSRFGDLGGLDDAQVREGIGALRVAYGYAVSIDFMQARLMGDYRAAQRALLEQR